MAEGRRSARIRALSSQESPPNRIRARLDDERELPLSALNEDVPFIVTVHSDDEGESVPKKSRNFVAVDSVEEVSAQEENQDEDTEEACNICFENFTTTGAHRLVSLKCGHFFGESCIRRWINTCRNQGCPNCKVAAKLRDIRHHYTVAVKVVDNSLLEDLRLRMQASQRETELLRAEKQELEQKLQGYIANCFNKESASTRLCICQVSRTRLSAEEGSRAIAHNGDLLAVAVKLKSNGPFKLPFAVAMYDTGMNRRGETVSLFAKRIRTIEFSPYDSELYFAAGEDTSCVVRSVDGLVKYRIPLPASVFSGCWSGKEHIVLGLSNGRVLQMSIIGEDSVDLTNGEGRIPICRVAYFESISVLLIASFRQLRVIRNGVSQLILEDTIQRHGKVVDVSVETSTNHITLSFVETGGSVHHLFKMKIEDDQVQVDHATCRMTTSKTYPYMWRNDLFYFGDSLLSAVYEEDLNRICILNWNKQKDELLFRAIPSGAKVTEIRGFSLREGVVRLLVLAESELFIFHIST